MQRRTDVFCGVLSVATIVSFIACIAVQTKIHHGTYPPGRITVERIEGAVIWASGSNATGAGSGADVGPDDGMGQVRPVGPADDPGVVTLSLLRRGPYEDDGSGIVLMVNGEAAADFRFGRASLMVRRGDLIEVEACSPADGLAVIVVDSSRNVRSPRVGAAYSIGTGRRMLANVIM